MPQHEYTPTEALHAILGRLAKASPELHDEVIEVIDAGVVEEVSSGRKKYFKSRQLSDEETLAAAIRVMRSYFVELPQCIASASDEISSTELATFKGTLFSKQQNEFADSSERILEIEQVAETVRTADAMREQSLFVEGFSVEQIAEQQDNFETLRKLLDFGDD